MYFYKFRSRTQIILTRQKVIVYVKIILDNNNRFVHIFQRLQKYKTIKIPYFVAYKMHFEFNI